MFFHMRPELEENVQSWAKKNYSDMKDQAPKAPCELCERDEAYEKLVSNIKNAIENDDSVVVVATGLTSSGKSTLLGKLPNAILEATKSNGKAKQAASLLGVSRMYVCPNSVTHSPPVWYQIQQQTAPLGSKHLKAELVMDSDKKKLNREQSIATRFHVNEEAKLSQLLRQSDKVFERDTKYVVKRETMANMESSRVGIVTNYQSCFHNGMTETSASITIIDLPGKESRFAHASGDKEGILEGSSINAL